MPFRPTASSQTPSDSAWALAERLESETAAPNVRAAWTNHPIRRPTDNHRSTAYPGQGLAAQGISRPLEREEAANCRREDGLTNFQIRRSQTLERKSRFIHQVAQGGTDIARTVDDVSETTLSLAEVKALSTGSPLILEKAGIDNDVARLERLASAHRSEQRRAGQVITAGQAQLPALAARVKALHAALGRRVDVSGGNFAAHHRRAPLRQKPARREIPQRPVTGLTASPPHRPGPRSAENLGRYRPEKGLLETSSGDNLPWSPSTNENTALAQSGTATCPIA
jgi:hypothetical protein